MGNERDLNYYLSLPYTIELIREDDTTWFARVVELPGCMTEGDSPEDAVAMIQDAMAGWIEIALEDGRSIPTPRPADDFSGKFVVRVPKSLHRELVDAAAREEVSLNQFIVTELARGVGRQAVQPAPVKAAPVTVSNRDPYWPGLTSGVRQVLASTGYGVDADSIDERLCAGWFEQNLAGIEAALDVGLVQDAAVQLNNLSARLQLVGERSPLVGVMQQLLHLMRRSIEAEAKLRNDGLAHMSRTAYVTEHASARIRMTATMASRDEPPGYPALDWPTRIPSAEQNKW